MNGFDNERPTRFTMTDPELQQYFDRRRRAD